MHESGVSFLGWLIFFSRANPDEQRFVWSRHAPRTTTTASTKFNRCLSLLAANVRSSIATAASQFRVCPRAVKWADVINVYS